MRRIVQFLALVLGLVLLPLDQGRAQTWDMVCGGDNLVSNGLGLCASVNLSFGATDPDGDGWVTMDVWNYAEFAPGDVGNINGVFTKIAFYNVALSVSILEFDDPTPEGLWGGTAGEEVGWEVGDNPEDYKFSASGGQVVQFGAKTPSGIGGGIASGATLPAGPGIQDFYYSTAASPVRFRFLVENLADWDVTTTGLAVHAQNLGDDREGSTTCLTYGDDINCGSNIVPEPGTIFLLGTGLAGLGVVVWRRREEDGIDV